MKLTCALGLSLGLAGSTSLAALPPSSPPSKMESILSERGDQKFDELKALGPQVYQDLRHLTFNENRGMPLRWQAFMAMVRIGERESLPEVHTALQSKDWFLRDAALKVLPALDSKEAYSAALLKLHDGALVVRSAAVDALAKVKDPHCAPALWNQLYSKDNFIGHQSLWIRRHVVEALAELSPKGTEAKFIKVLDDRDTTLIPPAIKGLERLTGQKLGDDSVPPLYRKFYWKKWYKESIASRH